MMKRKIEALRVFIWIFFAAVFCGSVPAVFAETVFAAEISCCEVSGAVSGLQGTDYETAGVVLYNSVNAYQADVDAEGRYVFHRVVQDDYFLKIEADGYKVSKPIAVSVTSAAFTVAEHLQVEKVDDADFFYQWKADDTYFGYEEYAGVPEKKQITFLDEDVYVPDSHAAYKLFSRYNIILSNEQEKWSSEYTSRMFELVKDIRGYNQYQAPSKWILTDQHLEHDIKITYGENGNVVLVAKEAFTNAIPRKASLGKLKGSYFSNRLYHVLIRYITREGTDLAAVDNILRTDYGCSVIVEDYAMLTKDTTGETAAAFEQNKPEELLSILEMFAEMPEGLHKVSGLEYLVRRIDGSVNPIYPTAAAVSWVYAEHGFIEFIDKAFLGEQVEDTFRLVLHEKSHFLWKNVFSDELKKAWQKVGGWYQTDAVKDLWATTKETEFVTAYAHAHNPDEDMAESVAYYILMPDKLESRSKEKYDFIKNYIMNGEIYMAQIREDLTFEVYNLYPDYAFPGRLIGLDIQIEGEREEDKVLTITAKLDTQGKKEFGAEKAFLRIISSVNTSYDMYLDPVNEDHSVLRGTLPMSKYACKGYWYCSQIRFDDEQGNQRFAGVDRYGWKLYLDNLLSDTELPKYVPDSLKVELEPGTLEGKNVTYVNITFQATDNIGVESCYCAFANNTHDSYRMEKWGTYDPETQMCKITYPFTEYFQSGEYSINHIFIQDYAKNQKDYYFYKDGSGADSYTTFTYESEHSDYEAPEINLNNISLTAYPTHPENPNGETVVNIEFYAKDNLSGLGLVSYRLLDPIGNTHFEYLDHENWDTVFFKGDPTVWKKYNIHVILPEGSVPGIWGLLELDVSDKAGNNRKYNFLEIIHFVIDQESNKTTYTLDADAEEAAEEGDIQLSIQNRQEEKEYVWECINGTGMALIDQSGKLTGVSAGTVTVVAYEKDNPSCYAMREITISHVVAEDAKVEPTCTESGLTEGKHCSVCKKVLLVQEEIPATGHGETETRNAKAASCQEAGYTGDVYCKVCNEELEKGRELSKLEHVWNEGTVTKEADCTNTGEKEYACTVCGEAKTEVLEALGHAYDEAYTVDKEASCTEAGSQSRHCQRCDARTEITEIPAAGHGETETRNAKAASCQEAGYTGDVYCKVCNTELKKGNMLSPTGHSWDAGTITKEPSYTESGILTYVCSICKETKTEQIARKTAAASLITTVTNTAKGISVQWKPVEGAAGYIVYRRTANGAWSKIASVKGAASYTDTKVKNGKSYTYAVSADDGSNPIENSAAGQTIVRLTAPKVSKPKNSKKKSFTVKWTKVPKAQGYQIQYSASKKFKKAENLTVPAKALSKTIKSLKTKTYYIRICAYKTTGNETYYSAWSDTKRIKIRPLLFPCKRI